MESKTLEDMIKTWSKLIEIADKSIMDDKAEAAGYELRKEFQEVVTSQEYSRHFSAMELIIAMSHVTEMLERSSEQSYFAGQLSVLSCLLASYFPATAGLAATAYECSIKTLIAERFICPN